MTEYDPMCSQGLKPRSTPCCLGLVTQTLALHIPSFFVSFSFMAFSKVTSYNEWGEGTQIEPAKRHRSWKGLSNLEGSGEGGWGGELCNLLHLCRRQVWQLRAQAASLPVLSFSGTVQSNCQRSEEHILSDRDQAMVQPIQGTTVHFSQPISILSRDVEGQDMPKIDWLLAAFLTAQHCSRVQLLFHPGRAEWFVCACPTQAAQAPS